MMQHMTFETDSIDDVINVVGKFTADYLDWASMTGEVGSKFEAGRLEENKTSHGHDVHYLTTFSSGIGKPFKKKEAFLDDLREFLEENTNKKEFLEEHGPGYNDMFRPIDGHAGVGYYVEISSWKVNIGLTHIWYNK